LWWSGCEPKAEILDRQQVEAVHDLDQVGGADVAHIVLDRVEVADLLVDALPGLCAAGPYPPHRCCLPLILL
jgi:hypothetical protein